MADILSKFIAHQNMTGGRHRVWSLVVTIFGDAIEPRGGVLRLGALQKITEHIGIEGNALRTAMSRLASDGWLERQRIGRASYYKPSLLASGENNLASKVIYQFFPERWDGKWLFAVPTNNDGFSADAKSQLHNSGFAFHGRKLAIAPDLGPDLGPELGPELGNVSLEKLETAGSNQDVMMFCVEEADAQRYGGSFGGKFEDLLNNVSFHHDQSALYGEFSNSASSLLASLKDHDDLDGLDAFILRTLLVHQWRRIVLRDVKWPRELRSDNWPGFCAQSLISELYERLLVPSEKWLSDLDATPGGKLPQAERDLSLRFKF